LNYETNHSFTQPVPYSVRCSGSQSIEPFVGKWKESLTGMIFTLDPSGRYTMTDNEGTETGVMNHHKGDVFILKIDNGGQSRFKITATGDEMTWEVGGTALKLSRFS
jgi:hypothetical protein